MVMAWMLERGGLAVARAAESVGLEASGQMASLTWCDGRWFGLLSGGSGCRSIWLGEMGELVFFFGAQ